MRFYVSFFSIQGIEALEGYLDPSSVRPKEDNDGNFKKLMLTFSAAKLLDCEYVTI